MVSSADECYWWRLWHAVVLKILMLGKCLPFPSCAAAATCSRRASGGLRAVCAAPAEENPLVHPTVHGAHGEGPAPDGSSFCKGLCCSAGSCASSSQLPASQNLQCRTLLLGKMRSFGSDVCGDEWERGTVSSSRGKEWHPILGVAVWPVTGPVGQSGILVF